MSEPDAVPPADHLREELRAQKQAAEALRQEITSLRHEAEARWGEVERFRRQAEALRQEAAGLRKDWRLLEKSPAWGAVSAYRRFFQEVIVPRPNLRSAYEATLGTTLRIVGSFLAPQNVKDAVAPKALAGGGTHGPAPFDVATVKFLLMVSGSAGDSFRYRCSHQAEELGFSGLSVDTVTDTDAELDDAVWGYDAFVLHRVPYTPMLRRFLERARSRSKPVIFDCDDLVFDPRALREFKGLEVMTRAERAEFRRGVKGYQKTLALCDAAIVSTEPLREEMQRMMPHLPIWVNRNAVSDEMLRLADVARQRATAADEGQVRVAYLSGSRTHHRDFDVVAPALARVLGEHPEVELLLVGAIEIPAGLSSYEKQIRLVPFLPWQKLPELLSGVHINLAPLELENRFTEGKSALKYIEAALVEVPTIASPTAPFREVIRSGENGFLATNSGEWNETLERLVVEPELRRRVGRCALEDVLANHTTRSRAALAREAVGVVIRRFGAPPRSRLSIAFVLRAPIAPAGGGYRTIFGFARALEARGHLVRIYVERIAHLAGKSDEEISEFCREHFGLGAPHIRVGHDSIEPSDIAIATNWPTAFVVDRLQNARSKAYFIQDYEPDFYDPSDPLRPDVERTYSLPLKKIAFGRSLAELFTRRDRIDVDHVDFALDRSVFRNPGPRNTAGPVRILFFARPGMKRRAFSVGIEALEAVAKAEPDTQFALYGMKEPMELGFDYENLGELTSVEVAEQMGRSDIHLSFSLTNVSWVPFEAMACGCAVVECLNDNVAAMLRADLGTCLLSEPRSEPVADALLKLVRDSELRSNYARQGTSFIDERTTNWEGACADFELLMRRCVFSDPE